MPAAPHVPPAFLAGLIGTGIQGSRTPAMHEREGVEQGLRYIYKLIDLQADARALGAVNTVVLRDGRRIGENTDWWGLPRASVATCRTPTATALCSSARAAQALRWRTRC